ncbi:carbohydrate ABC transporter substrate-binding protein (CUT1 family) [Paenibacillus sp. BK033]|uniref:ABC transporter substrate-binding protein n=1 Tax=Paenibacillus sp. BK033 TaxID=2512133 RepID=UPI0010479C9C|nr:ABC transporter substrate-binding protein [Paenibacillus sp. BK033]TCM99212.1 carbohydrate ABC transporter substrate-binding protein (CUT1 family) [Paenibacillus sp. BK033]
MKYTARKLSLGAVSAVLALSLAACGSNAGSNSESGSKGNTGGGKKVTIELALSKSSQDSAFVQQDLLDEFEKETNIKVNLQLLPAEQTSTVLQTKLAVNETPDILQYNLASATTDLNLERNFEILDDQPWVSRLLNKDVLSAYGHVYSFHVSQDTGMQGVVYNKDIFKELGLEIPKTYDEFLAACEKIKAAGYTPIFMPFKDNWAANVLPGAAFGEYAAKNEPTLFDDLNANKKKWTDIKAFQTILDQQYDLYKKGYTNTDVLSDSYDMAAGKFLNKEVAMMFMGDWLIESVQQQDANMNLGLFAYPTDNGGDAYLGASPLGGQLFIPKKAKHIEEAKKFLDFIATKEVAQKIVNNQSYVSNLNDVTTPELPAYKQEILDNYITPKKVAMTMDAFMLVDRSELYRSLQDQFTGSKTSQQVLQTWNDKFAELMKDKGEAGF